MSEPLGKLDRAETAALIVETLAKQGIDVVLVGGSCVCAWTDERFGSLDLDFVDISYVKRKQIANALAKIGYLPEGKPDTSPTRTASGVSNSRPHPLRSVMKL